MADTIDIQNTNEWLSEISRRAQQLVDLIKAGYDVGQSGELGNLALFNVLADAPIGDAVKLRTALDTDPRKWGLGTSPQGLSSGSDLLDLSTACQFFSWYGGAPSNTPSSVSSYGAGITWSNTSGNYQYRFFLLNDSQNNISYGYVRSGFGTIEWQRFLSTGNTTVDSNGFVKKASPVFRLTGNASAATDDQHSEAGAGAANPKASGVTAEHVDTGHYVVRGALGLHNEGWNVELPRDSTGKHQCLAATDTAGDGTITVRTYAVVIDPRGIEVPGEPIDIAGEGWVTMRLCMPAEPTEEKPEPGTPTPGSDVTLEFVTPWTYKLDIWERMTDDEAETFEESFNATSAKNRGLWRDCRYIAHDSPLFDTLRGMMIEQWGEARADELLAPSA